MSAASDRWAERLARFTHAGQTVADFRADEGVSTPSFYLWNRKLPSPPSASSRPLVPITLTPTLATTGLELLLPSGLRLRLPADYPPHQLGVLLRTLEEPSC